MSVYIDLAPSHEQLAEIAQLIDTCGGKDSKIGVSCQKLLGQTREKEAIHLILNNMDTVWINDNDKDVECFFALLMSLLVRSGHERLEEAKEPLTTTLAQSTDRAPLRLSILSYIYNSYNSPEWRIHWFKAILKFCLISNQYVAVPSLIEQMDRLFCETSATTQQQRDVYFFVMQLSDGSPYLSNIRLKWLQTFDDEDLNSIRQNAEVCDIIQRAVLAHIADTNYLFEPVYICNAARLLQIVNPPLYELLGILTNATVTEFETFAEVQKNFFQNNEILSKDFVLHKMRILTLLSLAYTSDCIPYHAISESLHVPVEDVESWILETVNTGILNAKIDQENQVLLVSYALQREIQIAHWQSLKDKLIMWKENIQSMARVVKNARMQKCSGQQDGLMPQQDGGQVL
ncbi:eukaryotic translation initiation factor 3 subunit M-like [Schistocerca gregaria]|uniref:eukaryotic translation initiation factor 3 subunit M-like n=1 Tax=Schistocerca gregaria TaxID=7010 RepID=UPI00211EBB1B|nr:eukaryotic translation initiation factor 3 subunit M-like [Schistocerca gregaria]